MSSVPETVLSLLQAQWKHETANSMRYTARASWARFRGLEGTGDFFEQEAAGEQGHAKLVREFIEARNEALAPEGFAFDEPSAFGSFDALFTSALEVERTTTDMLNAIYAEAVRVADFQTSIWVQQLISEQTEEENLYQTIIDRMVQRGGGSGQDEALTAFRKDGAAIHDLDVWIAERFVK